MMMRFVAIGGAALAALLMMSHWTSAREQSGCGANGIAGGSDPLCTGTCNTGGGNCIPRNGSAGGFNYKYCGCANDGGETGCCHLILLTSGPQRGQFAVLGNCNIAQTGCNDSTKVCSLQGAGTVTSMHYALCIEFDPPPPQ
jgi:hypothetical protein